MFGAYNTSIKGTVVRKTCSNDATAGERRIWGGHSLCTREKRDMREEEHTKEKGI